MWLNNFGFSRFAVWVAPPLLSTTSLQIIVVCFLIEHVPVFYLSFSVEPSSCDLRLVQCLFSSSQWQAMCQALVTSSCCLFPAKESSESKDKGKDGRPRRLNKMRSQRALRQINSHTSRPNIYTPSVLSKLQTWSKTSCFIDLHTAARKKHHPRPPRILSRCSSTILKIREDPPCSPCLIPCHGTTVDYLMLLEISEITSFFSLHR